MYILRSILALLSLPTILFIVCLFTCTTLGLIYFPWLVFWIVIVSFAGILVRGILQFHYGFLKAQHLSLKHPKREKFISVHVPAYNEPPKMLKHTLDKLAQQNYTQYEVIVIDNNTSDPNIWKPIQAYCKKLGKKFRFYHVEHLKGFKAGALNYLKDRIDPRTECIAVVDADYEVHKNFLKEANKYFIDEKIGFIQFPQSYRNVNQHNVGLELEYQHFFLTYMNMANYFNCVTATGTLSVFRVEALKKVGFFNKDFITEDSDIGVRLNKVGYSGLYVPRIVGKGLMPYDLASYKKQKSRWANGNIQVLRHNFFSIIFDRHMTLGQKIGLLSQLTAWVNFTFFPMLIILTASVLRMINYQYYPMMRFLVFLSALAIITFLVFKLLSFYVAMKRYSSFAHIFKAFCIHIGLSGIYSFAILRLFLKKSFVFERTNKFMLIKMPGFIKNAFFEIVVSLGSFALALFHLSQNNYIYAGVLCILGFIFLTIIYVQRELMITKKVSQML